MGGFVPRTILFLVRGSVCPDQLFQLALMMVTVMATLMPTTGGMSIAFLFN